MISHRGGFGLIPAQCGIYGIQSGSRTNYSTSTSVPPVSIIPPMLHAPFHLSAADTTQSQQLTRSLNITLQDKQMKI
jgi:hypothetical protein